MKLPVHNLQNQKTGEKELPPQFSEEYRPDLIKRAVLALRSQLYQPHGSSPEAGKRHSAELSRRRRKYRGAYGFGISRVTRKILTRRGTRFYWVGALSPNTVGGRRAHPPKAEKNLLQRINKKEKRKALRSALAATLNPQLVQNRGHFPPENYPFIISSEIEKITKTKEAKEVLKRLNFQKELQRTLLKKIKAGLGKLRGRKYQKKKGLLVVVSDDCPLIKSAQNLPGLEVVKVNQLNAQLLAPGAQPARLTLYTEKAIEKLEKEKLFL